MNEARNEAKEKAVSVMARCFSVGLVMILGVGSAVGIDGFDFCYDGLYVIEGDRKAVGVPREFDEVFRTVDACLAVLLSLQMLPSDGTSASGLHPIVGGAGGRDRVGSSAGRCT